MIPGLGYYIYVSGASSLTYPTPLSRVIAGEPGTKEPTPQFLLSSNTNTGSSAVMMLIADNLSRRY